MLDRVAYNRGVHLRGTPLWFDAEVRRELGVITSLTHRPRLTHKRTVASSTVVRALEGLGYRGSLLPVPEGRWVGVGGQKLKFLDSEWLYCSPALLSVGASRLLVVGGLPAEPQEWPDAHHLVVGSALAVRSEHKGAPVERALERVVSLGREGHPSQLQVAVDNLDLGRLAFEALTEAGIPTRPLGSVGKLMRQATPESVARRAGVRVALTSELTDAPGRLVRMDSGLEAWAHPRRPDVTLRVKLFGGASAVVDIVKQTGARGLSVAGSPNFVAALDTQLKKQLGSRGKPVAVQRLVTAEQLVLSGA